MCMCVCTPNVLGLVTCYPCYPPLLEMPPPSEAPPASPSFVGFGGSSDSRASDAKCRCPGPLFGDLDLDPELAAPIPTLRLRPLDVDAPIAHASSSGLDPNATRLTSSV